MRGSIYKLPIYRLLLMLGIFGSFLYPHAADAIEFQDVVASIEGEDIIFEQLLPKKAERTQRLKKLGERAYSRWVLRFAAASLRARLLKYARQELKDELGLKPSESQVRDFVEQLETSKRKELEELRSEKENILKQLESGAEAKEQRDLQLRTRLEELDVLITSIEEYLEFAEKHPELRETLDVETATRFLSRWLVDRELFLQFGGRVAFRYGGPEPIDAYRTLLKQGQAAEKFHIHSKVLEQMLWSYFYREGRVLLIPEEDARKIYTNPTWSLE